MKQRRYMFYLLVVISVLTVFTCAHAANDYQVHRERIATENNTRFGFDKDIIDRLICEETAEVVPPPVFKLPASLQVIEDEAFEGTSLFSVELPDSVVTIGERAFSNISTLHAVSIPDSVTYIARNAFTGSKNVTITASPGSYARTWAKENGVPFHSIIVLYAGTGHLLQIGSALDKFDSIEIITDSVRKKTDLGTQWRAVGEIAASKYKECIANHVQGRSPPVCS